MKKFTSDMTLGDAMKLNKKAETVFLGFGMHCFSCGFATMETLEEAAMVHDIDLDLLLAKLNELQVPKRQTPIKITRKQQKNK